MTLEEQYTKETGIDLYTMDGPHEILDIYKYRVQQFVMKIIVKNAIKNTINTIP